MQNSEEEDKEEQLQFVDELLFSSNIIIDQNICCWHTFINTCCSLYQPTPAEGLDCPSSLCSNLLCDSNVSMISNILLHIYQIYCFVDGGLVEAFDEDEDSVLSICRLWSYFA
jgi:hypothetical protein